MSVRFDNGRRVIERWDRVFEAVSAEPRRQLIVSLLDAEEGDSVPLPESGINPNVPVDAEEFRAQLYHTHLPKLAEWDFIEWERDPLRAFRGSRFDEVAVVSKSCNSRQAKFPIR
jgi:hypothetical protein